jgi:hypothetical protein
MFRMQSLAVAQGERAVSRLRFALSAAMLMGIIGAGASALADDRSGNDVIAPQAAKPPSGDATKKPGARRPRAPQVTPPMTPGCPYRGAKLELVV